MKDNHQLPEWYKTQIEGQKKINRRLSIRMAVLLVIVAIVIVVAILVAVFANGHDSASSKPATDASVAQIEKYEKNHFADNNAATIENISRSSSTNVLLIKIANVDVSTHSSAANSFSQMADVLQSVGSFDEAKHGVLFYDQDHNYDLYYNQSTIRSFNRNYSDYVDSGNYVSFVDSANAYRLNPTFKNSNSKLSQLDDSRSSRIITESFD
ncbi:hypothetical protein [Companilactobacillus furfuricola]|uniref:hypothetical protein n=1 Tax=Companilactobacillus furfuricola TaxID=1462575 RepID=UPI000F78FF83|nr:hypothetical protein [Companilactobacillus furfuricola]